MSDRKDFDRQMEICRSENGWDIWRRINPAQVQSSPKLVQAVVYRLQATLGSLHMIYPAVHDYMHLFLSGQENPWLSILAELPLDDDSDHLARLDTRMTVVCLSWMRGHSIGSYLLPNGLAPRIISQNLFQLAENPPWPTNKLLSKPRFKRTEKEHKIVKEWQRQRKEYIRLMLAWMSFDGLSLDIGRSRKARDSALTEYQGALQIAWDIKEREKREENFSQEEAEALAAAGAAPDGEYTPSPPPPPRMRVLAAEPEIKSGRDSMGAEEHKRWVALAKPIPLAAPEHPETIINALQREFPWMQAAVDHVRMDLALSQLRPGGGWFHLRPLLLVGPPGCGKTRFARRLAELAGVYFRSINAGGSSDARDLQGTARGWSTAEPSAVLKAIRDGSIANPVILVDEIEKASPDRRNGRIVDTLLGMLEPESARSWFDECLCVSANLTAVNWIVAANQLSGIPEPLRNRLTIIQVGQPDVDDFATILASIRRDIAAELGLEPFALPDLLPEIEQELEAAFRAGASIRKIRAAVLSAAGAALAAPRVIH